MIQEQVRSRLTYGIENCDLAKDAVDKLETFENNILKEYLGVPRNSFSTPLLDIVKVKPLAEAIAIRKYSFLRQIISNELTNKILHSDISHDLCTLITGCGYTNCSTDTALERDNKIIYSCHKSIKEIKKLKTNRQTCLDGYNIY